MPTQEITSTNWETFCQRFVDLHRGALMSVRKIEPSGRSVEIVREMPLTKAWMEEDACNNKMFFNFEQEGRREVIHQIVEPIHVKVREEAEGQKGLQIDAEDGSTLILFRSGKIGQLLDGLQTL
jgi:hypothetical protein